MLLQDIRYQLTYGFYTVYALISAAYVGILRLLPDDMRTLGAAIIILTDPAALGFFFIGGIWLLEEGEGLHGLLSVLPVKPVEYVVSKLLSLALISTLSGIVIVSASGIPRIDCSLLCPVLVLGAGIFTLAGLTLATRARTVNHYAMITIPAELLLIAPVGLIVSGIQSPLLNMLPGAQLYYGISASMGLSSPMTTAGILVGLASWFLVALGIALRRVPTALRTGGMG